MKHELPKLPYSFDALEPHIDAKTMQIHYEKHHQAYIDKLNSALEQEPKYADWSLEDLMTKINELPESIRTVVRNNGGGHLNHTFFWSIMSSTPNEPSQKVLDMLSADLGGLEEFKKKFKEFALARFGSGWVWLVVSAGDNKDMRLEVASTPNQDSPLLEGKTPILGLDVWEHAYYLNYQNRRGDYVDSWWNVVDWSQVEKIIEDLS